jgi:hypothetical protein
LSFCIFAACHIKFIIFVSCFTIFVSHLVCTTFSSTPLANNCERSIALMLLSVLGIYVVWKCCSIQCMLPVVRKFNHKRKGSRWKKLFLQIRC